MATKRWDCCRILKTVFDAGTYYITWGGVLMILPIAGWIVAHVVIPTRPLEITEEHTHNCRDVNMLLVLNLVGSYIRIFLARAYACPGGRARSNPGTARTSTGTQEYSSVCVHTHNVCVISTGVCVIVDLRYFTSQFAYHIRSLYW